MCKSKELFGVEPVIRQVNKNELDECLKVIHQSFSTVAEQFGLTKENCPKHTSFIPLSFLETQTIGIFHSIKRKERDFDCRLSKLQGKKFPGD